MAGKSSGRRLCWPPSDTPAALNIAPQEKDLTTPRQAGYRVLRAVVDLVTARPIDLLAVVDGVKTMTVAEGPWGRAAVSAVSPGVIVAGANPVNTDLVCMSVMGFDPDGRPGPSAV